LTKINLKKTQKIKRRRQVWEKKQKKNKKTEKKTCGES
jgi:hypothetical protein